MLINTTPLDTAALQSQLSTRTGLTIACYCAEWCGTCKGYRTDFANLSEKFPQHLFVWIDIEDNPELLDDIDVENFPTILIQQKEHNHFFGTMLPHIQHLERIILATEDNIAQNKSPSLVEGPASLSSLI
ncbi:MAG: thioredoxin family protein [Pelistega sp.]|nr:thioredoxin family protein [Pelistega sp.]